MKGFKSFVIALVTNRLGIILATINLCYLAPLFAKYSPASIQGITLIVCIQNFPAGLFAMAFGLLTEFVFPQLNSQFKKELILVAATFFVTLQWLFIAWTAKVIARKLRKVR